jgi:hypothetical protein
MAHVVEEVPFYPVFVYRAGKMHVMGAAPLGGDAEADQPPFIEDFGNRPGTPARAYKVAYQGLISGQLHLKPGGYPGIAVLYLEVPSANGPGIPGVLGGKGTNKKEKPRNQGCTEISLE